MIAAPSYQRYPKDIVSSGEIAALSLEEFGALTLLLDHDWIETGLPMNLKILAKFVRISERKMQKLWLNISRFFVENGERWMNPGLQIEREKQAHRRASLSENGKKGGRPPKATALPKETSGFISDNQMKSLSSSSSSSSSTAVLTTTCTEPETAPASVLHGSVIELACVGSKKNSVGITTDQLAQWQSDFPGVNVMGELRTMHAWLDANPTRRKTAKGIPRFVVAWLAKRQDGSGNAATLETPRRSSYQTPHDRMRENIAIAEARVAARSTQ